jgi:hypothetical protein
MCVCVCEREREEILRKMQNEEVKTQQEKNRDICNIYLHAILFETAPSLVCAYRRANVLEREWKERGKYSHNNNGERERQYQQWEKRKRRETR